MAVPPVAAGNPTAALDAAAAAAANPATNNPTAKPGAQLKTYHQPPFDPYMTAHSYPLGTGTNEYSRGFLKWDTSQGSPGGNYSNDDPAYVWFLYNPSTISTSYQMASGDAQAALNYTSTANGGNGGLLIPMQQQTSFTIMFDRTYEMNNIQTLAANPNLTSFGVEVDVAALRQYTGMYADVYAGNSDFTPFQAASSTGTATSTQAGTYTVQNSAFNTVFGDLSQGIMQLTIGYCYFGGIALNPGTNAGSANNYAPWGITYYGYIDSWSVEYTHFTQRMVPIRCVVDISFTFLVPPITPPNKAAAAQIGAAQQNTANLGTQAVVTPANPTPGGTAGR